MWFSDKQRDCSPASHTYNTHGSQHSKICVAVCHNNSSQRRERERKKYTLCIKTWLQYLETVFLLKKRSLNVKISQNSLENTSSISLKTHSSVGTDGQLPQREHLNWTPALLIFFIYFRLQCGASFYATLPEQWYYLRRYVCSTSLTGRLKTKQIILHNSANKGCVKDTAEVHKHTV